MTEECPVCKMKVELTKVEDHPDYKRTYYSCGYNVRSLSEGL
jgi:YHS domain-containing protein